MANQAARGRGLGAGDGGWEGFAFEGPDTDVGFGHAGGDEEVVLGEVEASDTAEHLLVHGSASLNVTFTCQKYYER